MKMRDTKSLITYILWENSINVSKMLSDLNMDHDILDQMESNKRVPREDIDKIAKYLDVSTEYLLGQTKCRYRDYTYDNIFWLAHSIVKHASDVYLPNEFEGSICYKIYHDSTYKAIVAIFNITWHYKFLQYKAKDLDNFRIEQFKNTLFSITPSIFFQENEKREELDKDFFNYLLQKFKNEIDNAITPEDLYPLFKNLLENHVKNNYTTKINVDKLAQLHYEKIKKECKLSKNLFSMFKSPGNTISMIGNTIAKTIRSEESTPIVITQLLFGAHFICFTFALLMFFLRAFFIPETIILIAFVILLISIAYGYSLLDDQKIYSGGFIIDMTVMVSEIIMVFSTTMFALNIIFIILSTLSSIISATYFFTASITMKHAEEKLDTNIDDHYYPGNPFPTKKEKQITSNVYKYMGIILITCTATLSLVSYLGN